MKKHSDTQNLIERIDRLVRMQSTGIGEEFAAKLSISRDTLFRLLRYLRAKGSPIKYCRYRRTYYYYE